jgi:hypothetical protein
VSAAVVLPSRHRQGRPPSCPREVAVKIIVMRRRQGLSLMQICIRLNAQGVPTPSGQPFWQKSYVDRLLRTRYVQDLIEEGADS